MLYSNTNSTGRNGHINNAANAGQNADEAANGMTLLWPMCKDLDRKLFHKKGKKAGQPATAHELSLTLSAKIEKPHGLPIVRRRVKANHNARPKDDVIQVLTDQFEEDIFVGPTWKEVVQCVESHTTYPNSTTTGDGQTSLGTIGTGTITDIFAVKPTDTRDEALKFKEELFILTDPILALKKRANETARNLPAHARGKFTSSVLKSFQSFIHEITEKL